VTQFYKYTSRQGGKETLFLLGLREGMTVLVADQSSIARLTKRAKQLGRSDLKFKPMGEPVDDSTIEFMGRRVA